MENPKSIKQILTENLTFDNQENVKQIIETIFNQRIHISTKLMDAKPRYRALPEKFGRKRITEEIADYRNYIEMILNLGWIEHTGDWDPQLRIEMRDGTIYETGYGYTEFWIEDPKEFSKTHGEDRGENETLYFLMCNEDDEEWDLYLDPIKIQSITMER